MKEKKTDSFFLFRKSATRYSFIGNKKKTNEAGNVQIQRLSWASNGKIPASDPTSGQQVPRRTKSSSDNSKTTRWAKGALHNTLSDPKSSSVFRSSSSTMRQLFTIGSSSSNSTSTPSSSCNSSASSSPKVRQSWSSGVTHILERFGNDPAAIGYVDDPFADDFQSRRGSAEAVHLQESFRKLPSPREGLVANKFFLNYTRNAFPVESLREENEEDEIMITPKIICAHEKTPGGVCKDRTQILQELEYIKELGMLPEELESEILSSKRGSGSECSNYETYSCSGADLNLNALRGYKTPTGSVSQSEVDDVTTLESSTTTSLKSIQEEDYHEDKKISETEDSVLSTSRSSFSSSLKEETNPDSVDSESNEFFGSGTFLKESTERNTLEPSSLNSILVNDDDSEDMTNDEDDSESSSFEKRLEDDLENLVEREEVKEKENEVSVPTFCDEERVQLRRKNRPLLYIDIERARSGRTLSVRQHSQDNTFFCTTLATGLT